jgi:3-deoxy-7-phosphoheptulonate synthase
LSAWTPWDWKERKAAQQPEWPDLNQLELVEKELSSYSPLVFPAEIEDLKSSLAQATRGQAFLLQAGDCAESFNDHSAKNVRDRLKVILQMAVVLTYSSGVSVIKVGRMAGQYAKPRSAPTESYLGMQLPSFRGHIVHSDEPDPLKRIPDPRRLIMAYQQSLSTINILRSLTTGGFADLSRVHTWNQEFVASSSEGERYDAIATEITRALNFMEACGINLDKEVSLKQVKFWTSHEALLLGYEAALTRLDPKSKQYYDLSGHMVWIGERTRDIDGAHVRFASGISNPIGLKVGPKITAEELDELCKVLNPENTEGRLTLITRMGAETLRKRLPELVEQIQRSGRKVLWTCDPMHGNTFTSTQGLKTRRFDDVVAEIRAFFDVHREIGTWPGGIHIELTGDDVTECLGGSLEVFESELDTQYNTICDPRLNARQSLDLAYQVAEMLF